MQIPPELILFLRDMGLRIVSIDKDTITIQLPPVRK